MGKHLRVASGLDGRVIEHFTPITVYGSQAGSQNDERRRCCFYAAVLLTLYATLAAAVLAMGYVRRELDAAPLEWLGGGG